jgi:hypothetical protein
MVEMKREGRGLLACIGSFDDRTMPLERSISGMGVIIPGDWAWLGDSST